MVACLSLVEKLMDASYLPHCYLLNSEMPRPHEGNLVAAMFSRTSVEWFYGEPTVFKHGPERSA